MKEKEQKTEQELQVHRDVLLKKTRQYRGLLNVFCSSGGIDIVKSALKNILDVNEFQDYNEINLNFTTGKLPTNEEIEKEFLLYYNHHFDVILINLWNYCTNLSEPFKFFETLKENEITYNRIEFYFYNSMVENKFQTEKPLFGEAIDKNLLYADFRDLLNDESTVMYVDNDYEIGEISKYHKYNFKKITNANEFAKWYFNKGLNTVNSKSQLIDVESALYNVDIPKLDESKRQPIIMINNKYNCFRWTDILDIAKSLPRATIYYTERKSWEKMNEKLQKYYDIFTETIPNNIQFINTRERENYLTLLNLCRNGFAFNLHSEAFGVKFFDYLNYNIKPLATKACRSNIDVLKMCGVDIINGFGTASSFINHLLTYYAYINWR